MSYKSRWNVKRLTEITRSRKQLAGHRLFPDSEVRRLQLRGSARLSRYVSRLSHQGFAAASAANARSRAESGDERADVAVLTGSVGIALTWIGLREFDDRGIRGDVALSVRMNA